MARIVIIGNSASGFSSCRTLVPFRENEITIISKEQYPAYDRSRLITYLSGGVQEKDLFLCGEDFYQQQGIRFLKGAEVVRLDLKKQRVVLKDNAKIEYDYLIIASGEKTEIPDIPGRAKTGVIVLDTLEDARKIQERLLVTHTVCIIGRASWSLALAEFFLAKNKEVKVICAEAVVPIPLSGLCEIIQPGAVSELIGEGELQAVKLANGKVIGSSMAVFLGDQVPSVNFLKETGIRLQDGYVITDSRGRTNIENIFACGSVCRVEGDGAQVKVWDACVQEGILAAEALMDKTKKGTENMSADLLVQLGTKGADAAMDLTRASLEKTVAEKGKEAKVGFPETNYYFPLCLALLQMEVKTLGDCLLAFKEIEALHKNTAAKTGLLIPALGGILNKGIATLLCEEILAALSVENGSHPKDGIGFIPDKILRSLGLQLVDGRISGIAVILGPAKDEASAATLIRNFQSKSIVTLLAGNINGKTFEAQLKNQGIEVGLENYIVPLGSDYLSAIYAVNFAVRAPLIYGGFKPGQWLGIAEYMRNRVPAFVLLLGHVDELLVATGLGVLAFGLPIITDLDVPQLGKIDTTLYEALVTEKDYTKIASLGILTRGIKVKMTEVAIPVPYAAAFEGERVRKENLHVEFGGKSSESFEFLTTKGTEEVEDGRAELFGPDIDRLEPGKRSLPLAIIVEVYGRKMQKDFEPILERQIHRFVNYAMGLMHVGQRDMNWIRISRDAFAKGFRLKHIATILHAMLHQEYSAIVDKVQVKLYTQLEDIQRLIPEAKKAYEERDERLGGMTDESVDTFYSCLLCQSFAPNHVCMVTPERLGLCGAYSWLDAKASYEITPTGPNQPVAKGSVLDAKLGQWKNVNDFLFEKSNKSIEKVSMYSLMDSPQSSCGCFECIVAIIPEANGVMVVHRDYSGMTPSGMNFTTLAGSVGGGVQTPGFLGVGKLYILSKKFISAEGGLKRLVWMPKELKELLGEKLKKRCQEIGMPDLIDKIADETQATRSEELLQVLSSVKHPALGMEPIL